MVYVIPNNGMLAYVAVLGTVLLFAILSNFLLIYCIVRIRKLRTVTNALICNLSVSDILLAGFVIPQKLHDIFHKEHFFEGNILCKLVNFSPIFIISNSVYTLVCLSYERHSTITESGDSRMKFKTLAALIVFIWLFAFVISLPTLLEYSVLTIEKTVHIVVHDQIQDKVTRKLVCASEMSYRYALLNAVFVFLISYVVPVILMTKNYLEVAMFVWKKGRSVRDNTFNASSGPNGRFPASLHLFKHRVKLMKLLVMVAMIFAVSWLPFFILFIYAKATGNDASEKADGFANLLLIALATFSTAYNIILYIIFNPSFRKAMITTLKCAIKDDSIQRRAFNEQSRPTSATHDVKSVMNPAVGTSNMFPSRSISRMES